MKLLFDSHISPDVARGLLRRFRRLEALQLRDWQQRRFLNAADSDLLAAAAGEGWTLVTYDLRTIVPLLRNWAENEQHHAGVILVDDRTIPADEVGALVATLGQLWRAQGSEDWTDRVQFLRRAGT